MGRKTKIVCTMGPASWSEEGLGKLIDAGMNVACLDFANPALTHELHQEVLDRLRKVQTKSLLFFCFFCPLFHVKGVYCNVGALGSQRSTL